MKTLDEVIKKIEKQWVCPSSDEADEYCELYDVRDDALHYLKAFRDAKDALEREKDRYAEAVKNCERAENIYKQKQKAAEDVLWKISSEMNPALTWDELRTMEGKPVWVEVLSDEIDLSSRWMMVARETKAHSLPLAYTDDMGHWIYGHEDDLGKTWQAYRKERK